MKKRTQEAPLDHKCSKCGYSLVVHGLDLPHLKKRTMHEFSEEDRTKEEKIWRGEGD